MSSGGSSSSGSIGGTGTGNRLQEFVMATPIVTFALLVLNISIYILTYLTSYNVGLLAFNPIKVLFMGEYYRAITSVFLHGGIMHIGQSSQSLTFVMVVEEGLDVHLALFYI